MSMQHIEEGSMKEEKVSPTYPFLQLWGIRIEHSFPPLFPYLRDKEGPSRKRDTSERIDRAKKKKEEQEERSNDFEEQERSNDF